MEKKPEMKTNELCNRIWDFETTANRDFRRGNIKYILIHPNEFIELAKDKESHKFLYLEKDKITFMGIPMIRTPEIEYVDFCI